MWTIVWRYVLSISKIIGYLWPAIQYIINLFKKPKMESKQRLGLLTKEQEKFFGEWLDKKIVFKNSMVEAVDGTAFIVMVRVLDDLLLERLPENWKSPIETMIDSLIDGDENQAVMVASSILTEKIDIPILDEYSEQRLVESIMHTLASLVLKYIKN